MKPPNMRELRLGRFLLTSDVRTRSHVRAARWLTPALASIADSPIYVQRLRWLLLRQGIFEPARMSDRQVMEELRRQLARGRLQLLHWEDGEPSRIARQSLQVAVSEPEAVARPMSPSPSRSRRAPEHRERQSSDLRSAETGAAARQASAVSPPNPSLTPPAVPPLRSLVADRALDGLRQGVPGKLRSSAELDDAAVANSLNAQLMRVDPRDVEGIVNSFPEELREQARIVLARSSGFGSMESMNTLRAAMEDRLAEGATLYTPGRGSLANNIAYLAGKKTFKSIEGLEDGATGSVSGWMVVEPESVVVLDPVILHEIETSAEFAQTLVDNACLLLDPVGFNGGVHLFNSPTSEAIATRTAALLERARVFAGSATDEASFERAVEQALREPVTSVLERANPALLGLVRTVDPAAATDATSATIARQLSGDAGISAAELTQVLERFEPEGRPLMRELLVQEAEVFSAV